VCSRTSIAVTTSKLAGSALAGIDELIGTPSCLARAAIEPSSKPLAKAEV
jgi:hypothetical protein